jgi:hypothetical protein
MLPMPGTPPEPRSVPRRPVRMPAGDPLDEFADEREALIAPLPPTPRAALFRHDPLLVRQDAVAPEPRHRTKPRVVVRLQVPMTRLGAALAAAGLVTSGLGALFATALALTTDRGPAPVPYLTPSPSPIEIEYPDYPGAPALRAATATPSTLVAEQVAASIDAPAPAEKPTPRTVSPDPLRQASISPAVAEATARPFDVRSPMPQIVAASARNVGAVTRFDDLPPADAPPRRIGAPLTVTALGGTLSKSARLAMVLEVTEQGDVARVVSHEAVDVHSDVVDSITEAARSWRYEPARRDGIPVPARVRVVVQLNSGQ